MKKRLCLLMLLGVMVQTAAAQSIQLGLGGGGSNMSAPDNQDSFKETVIRWTPIVAASLKYVFRRYVQLGIEVSRTDFVRERDIKAKDANGNEVVQNQRIYAGSPIWTYGITAAYQRQGFYAGGQAALLRADKGGIDFRSATSVRTYLDGYSGWTAGGHLGYDLKVSDRILFFAEGRLHYIQGKYEKENTPDDLSFWSTQLLLGIRCNFEL
jgi:hypothetical protein